MANNNDYLAAEIQKDGRTILCTWPDDPMVAQRLFAELEYQYKVAMIDQAAKMREAVQQEMKDAKTRVKIEPPAALNGIRAQHGRS